jgi:glycerol-3-phosphate dehydrogenase
VESFDVCVIGGGVNGTGVARDLALRGLRVVLFERNDLAFGASGNSSGMIHGGVRYLETNPSVTETSCRDSGYIQQIAPFLLHRIPFLMPIPEGKKGRILLELIDAYFRAYDTYQPLKHSEPHTRISADELKRLEPGLVGENAGGVTFDEWGTDGARLCVLGAIDAEEHGAVIHTHTTVERAKRSGEDWIVEARDLLDERTHTISARVIVNATGAWSPITAGLGTLPPERVRVRPGKGIHVVYDRRVSNYGVLASAIDGRQIFMMPWQNVTTIGTTDDDYFGDLDDVVSTSEEVRYLVQGVERIFPAIREARAIGTYAGVRPTLYAFGKLEDSLSREHEIVDHESDGSPNAFSMIGGKLASFRLFAQEMSDRIARDLAPSSVCTTHTSPLPGGERDVDAMQLADKFEITPVAARRIVFRHGARAENVLSNIGKTSSSHLGAREVVCPCEPVLGAEIVHAVKHEHARTVEDVARRTRLGLGACGGMRCAERCGQIVARELELKPSEGRAQAHAFLVKQAKMRAPALGPEQARQEALAIAAMRAAGTEE